MGHQREIKCSLNHSEMEILPGNINIMAKPVIVRYFVNFTVFKSYQKPSGDYLVPAEGSSSHQLRLQSLESACARDNE